MIITTIKIRNRKYEITEADRFLDNGICIQLVTQKGRLRGWNYEPIVLTKVMVKHILSFPLIKYETKKRLFSITAKEIKPSAEMP